MSGTINQSAIVSRNIYLVGDQACVKSIRRSSLPIIIKAETEKFIERNVLPDCGKVPPNCLKAFMIRTVQKMGLNNLIPGVKRLFKSKIGYNGYYLDGGNLFHVEVRDS